jgi:hypothetical protein
MLSARSWVRVRQATAHLRCFGLMAIQHWIVKTLSIARQSEL